MAGDVTPTPIVELIDKRILSINDGYRAKNSELSRDGLPFARAQNINNGFQFEDADCFPLEGLHKVGSKISETGDVVFTSKGTVGRFAYVREDTPRFVYAPQLCFWRSLNADELHSRWLYYWMHSREFFIQFSSVAGQTDMAEYVSLRDQRRMHIKLPSLCEQQAIACILGALDDKIELNRRRIRTLEAMARALFQSWFIDFDPVRAKAAGRTPPGLKPELASLFPDRFEDSPLGSIPAGWQWRSLREIADLQSGGTPRKSNEAYWGGQIPWISPKAMNEIHVADSDDHVTEAAIGNGTRLVPEGTVLVMVRGMGLHQGVRMSQALRDVTFNQDVKAVVPTCVPDAFLLFGLLASAVFLHSKVQPSGHGTGVLPTEFLDRLMFAIPPDETIRPLADQLAATNERVCISRREATTLAELRDALLPKLISGELRVPDAERIVGRMA